MAGFEAITEGAEPGMAESARWRLQTLIEPGHATSEVVSIAAIVGNSLPSIEAKIWRIN